MAKEMNTFKEKESKTDIAYRILSKKKKEKNFYELWEEVKEDLIKNGATEEEAATFDDDISFFYTNLTLDGRFVNVGENKWNLRERVPFDKIHIDMNEIYSEEDEDLDLGDEDATEATTDEFVDDYEATETNEDDLGEIRESINEDEDE